MTLRCCTAHSIVTFVRFGMPLPEALRLAMEDLRGLDDPYASTVNTIAIDKDGNHQGASTSENKTYIVMREDMDDYDELPRTQVPLAPEPE